MRVARSNDGISPVYQVVHKEVSFTGFKVSRRFTASASGAEREVCESKKSHRFVFRIVALKMAFNLEKLFQDRAKGICFPGRCALFVLEGLAPTCSTGKAGTLFSHRCVSSTSELGRVSGPEAGTIEARSCSDNSYPSKGASVDR